MAVKDRILEQTAREYYKLGATLKKYLADDGSVPSEEGRARIFSCALGIALRATQCNGELRQLDDAMTRLDIALWEMMYEQPISDEDASILRRLGFHV